MFANPKKATLGGLLITALIAAPFATAAPANATIYLYAGKNYSGAAYNAEHGYKHTLGWFDNQASSLRVTGGDTATLYQFTHYRGQASVVFGIGSPDLSSWAFPGGGTWDNRASSVY